MSISGQMLHDAFNAARTIEDAESWTETHEDAQIMYIQAAQVLCIRTGEIAAGKQEYIFVANGNATEASDLKGIATLIKVHAEDEFQVFVIANGKKIGKGNYEVCGDVGTVDGFIYVDEEREAAQGIHEQLEAILQPALPIA